MHSFVAAVLRIDIYYFIRLHNSKLIGKVNTNHILNIFVT